MQQALGWNPTEADDGWYIDDVQVTNRLLSPATVTVDTADRSGLPGCGPDCTSVTAVLTATPPSPGAPGQPVVLDASASAADACPGGVLLFRFSLDEDDDGFLHGPLDVLLRDWTSDAILVDAPAYTARYVVEVRCSSRISCEGSTTALVTVPCPANPTPFPHSVRFVNRDHLVWDATARVDVVRGDLAALRAAAGAFGGTVTGCVANDTVSGGVQDFVFPPPDPGSAAYYLVREVGSSPTCARSWGTGVPQEQPGAGGDRDADLALDPNACP